MDQQKLEKLETLQTLKGQLQEVLRQGQQISQLLDGVQHILVHAGEQIERCTQVIDKLTQDTRKS